MGETRKEIGDRWLMVSGEDDPWNRETAGWSAWRLQQRSHLWRPPTDLLETAEVFIVLVEIAGMKGAEFSVSFERQVLSIRGTRGDTGGLKAYHQMEIGYGEFVTQVRIPVPVDAEGIEAAYQDGFLRVVLPKAQAKRIPISS
ncbi:MAG TPA: Hsp20/alpha crystallin family protein [Anaerolineales bacterium]|nr:Hsp20/alpha crystallin family protein [Anaerolineales bacterium]